MKLILLVLLLTGSYAQNFVRIFLAAYGEPTTISYFDYDPVALQVLRVQTLNDDQFINGIRNNAVLIISAFASDDSIAFGLLLEIAIPAMVTSVLSLNQTNCNMTKVLLQFGTGAGLTLDSVNKQLYYNFQNINGSGINRMNFDGTNLTTVFQYSTKNLPHWLSYDSKDNKLYTSLNSYQFSSLQIPQFSPLSFSTPSCQTSACDISVLGGSVDQSTGRLYYPDTQGINAFDPATNQTIRVLLIPNYSAKSILIDSQSSLLFMQMSPINGQLYDQIFVVPVNLVTAVADPTKLLPVLGLSGSDASKGNLLSVTHCTSATCAICGFPYTPQNSNGIVYATATQPLMNLGLLITLFAFLCIIR